jgi:hypothetical protein
LIHEAVVAIPHLNLAVEKRRHGTVVRLRRCNDITESLELTTAVVFGSQKIKCSQYIVSERLTTRAPRKRLLPQASNPQLLIQPLYTRNKLSLLSFQHFGITLREIPTPGVLRLPARLLAVDFTQAVTVVVNGLNDILGATDHIVRSATKARARTVAFCLLDATTIARFAHALADPSLGVVRESHGG